ncbi:PIN-like domain-containing protein [Actinokineospora cianjurensis]|uniref:PIN like domain-containing protein n=1 Tax=Actinokineospora cianjurensis TaxID=585224 RepID=A0A421B7Y8_9PSEU|nr:PIN-like domain-containing protein [Actinokineospora cianjurensis]RLK60439.1 hypothetical protein CLV68_0943 [Actinokineospora cianjurensis]
MRRIRASEPPGYKDRKKDDVNAVGDYLVWEQTLLEATTRGLDVLFVTSDTEEDWWRLEGGERRGPRIADITADIRRIQRARHATD